MSQHIPRSVPDQQPDDQASASPSVTAPGQPTPQPASARPGAPDLPMRPPGGGFSMRGMLVTLLPNVVLPWIIYQWLTSRGVSTISALMATAVVPLAVTLYSWLRDRRVDALGIMTLAFVAIGLVTSLISGDPIFYLVKESLLTGVWGLIMLGSLLASRPLTFYFGRQFMSGGDPERAAFFDRLWEVPEFRALQRKLSFIWGGGLIAEALVRVGLVYALPIPVFLIVSPAMGLGVTALLIGMSVVLGRRGQQRMRQLQRERKQATAQTQTMPA